MKINHLNLTVTNVLETRDFLKKYFGLRSIAEEGDKGTFVAMFDDDHLVLTLMRAGRATEIKYPDTFHIGFVQPSEERVNEIHEQLKGDGYEVTDPERAHAWTFYVKAPGGFTVEVLA